tara:strand:+ start:1003 stop:1428 length:426 start_codon:yes stop_codon:yes gene_type:complete
MSARQRNDSYRSLEEVFEEDVLWWRTKSGRVENMQDIIHMHRRKQLDLGWIKNSTAKLMELSADGGDCPKCGAEWELVQVDNKYARFHYFDPSCSCYPRCPRCDASLAAEFEQYGFAMKCGCGHNRDKSDQTVLDTNIGME